MELGYKDVITFIWVKDMDKALDFYTNTLGLSRVFEGDGWVELSVPGSRNAYIALNRWAKEGEMPINQFVTFRVNDLKQVHSHLHNSGVTFKGDTWEFYEEGMKMFKFSDFDGNIITISQVE